MQKLKLKKEYKKYPEYKDSGIDWIGKIPKEWEIEKIRHIGRMIGSTVDKKIDKNDKMINLINYKDVYNSNKITSNIDFMRVSATASQLIKNQVEVGDVLFTPSSETIEDIGHSSVIVDKLPNTLFSYHLVKLKFSQDIDNDYKKYLFNNDIVLNQFSSFAMGITRMVLSRDDFGKTNIVLASKKDQEKIAKFLDEKVDLIDEIVKKKKKLIELLKEKRTAVINQTVTKGLDSDIEMKDSGVEWIGEIPKSWLSLPLKRLVDIKITDGPHESPRLIEEGIPFISAESVRGNRIDFNHRRGNISLEDHREFCKKSKPQRNDVFIVKSGSTTGKITIVEVDFEFSIWSPLALVRAAKNKIVPFFLFYSLQNDSFQKQVQLFWSFGTQPNIGMGVIEKLVIAVPSITEQLGIVAHLNKELLKIDKIEEKIKKSINLLNEFKSSLISNVVTGKVRI